MSPYRRPYFSGVPRFLEILWTIGLRSTFSSTALQANTVKAEVSVACHDDTSALAGLLVNATPRPLYLRETATVPTAEEAGSASGPVWTGEEKTSWPHRGSSSG